jgi:predicted lysophospholipase L1 biosynthesis ABC-type transport system permease subunit
VWPTAALTAAQLQALPVASMVVNTDGAASTLERARTSIAAALPDTLLPAATDNDFGSDVSSQLAGFRQLADVVILASLPIAGCALAASVIGGLTDRRRPFSLLRLTGAPMRVLRRVVALETAVPLLVVSVFALAIGLLAAQLFLRAQLHYTLELPGPGYYAVVVAGLLMTLGIVASTLPLLNRITGPETARNE